MVALAETSKLTALIQAYCHFEAKEYHIAMLKFDDRIQFIDLDRLNIIEIDRDFKISQRQKLKVLPKQPCLHSKKVPGTGI